MWCLLRGCFLLNICVHHSGAVCVVYLSMYFYASQLPIIHISILLCIAIGPIYFNISLCPSPLFQLPYIYMYENAIHLYYDSTSVCNTRYNFIYCSILLFFIYYFITPTSFRPHLDYIYTFLYIFSSKLYAKKKEEE